MEYRINRMKEFRKRIKDRISALTQSLRFGPRWNYLVVHNRSFTALPQRILIPLTTRKSILRRALIGASRCR